MRVIILFFLFLSSQATSGQRTSCPEKWWAITHPFVACKALRISRTALAESKKMEKDSLLDKDPIGGQVDAFRHAYWMALLAQNIGVKKALSLGRAHEKGNYRAFKKHKIDEEGVPNDSLMSVMDLYNNEVGMQIGLASQAEIADSAFLKMKIIDAIRSGMMKILLKDASGNWLNCDGVKLNISVSLHNWYIPKCLVFSNGKR